VLDEISDSELAHAQGAGGYGYSHGSFFHLFLLQFGFFRAGLVARIRAHPPAACPPWRSSDIRNQPVPQGGQPVFHLPVTPLLDQASKSVLPRQKVRSGSL